MVARGHGELQLSQPTDLREISFEVRINYLRRVKEVTPIGGKDRATRDLAKSLEEKRFVCGWESGASYTDVLLRVVVHIPPV